MRASAREPGRPWASCRAVHAELRAPGGYEHPNAFSYGVRVVLHSLIWTVASFSPTGKVYRQTWRVLRLTEGVSASRDSIQI